MDVTDLELARRAAHGDHGAFDALVDRHMAKLYALAVTLSGNASDAQDIVQETFLGAFQGLKQFAGRSSVRTWLVQILVRQAARHRRHAGLRRTQSLEGAEATQTDPALQQAGTQAAVEQRLDLRAMLAGLSAEHREILLLRELEGWSYEQIAQALDLPRGTVESRLYRARLALRQQFQGTPVQTPPSATKEQA